jgi:nucleoside-diphosphate-sugar epimerase
MKILVTGSAGHLGEALLRQCLAGVGAVLHIRWRERISGKDSLPDMKAEGKKNSHEVN